MNLKFSTFFFALTQSVFTFALICMHTNISTRHPHMSLFLLLALCLSFSAASCHYSLAFLHMSVKYPERTHTHTLLRTPPLAYGASKLGEIVVIGCLCCLDLNWPDLNSELQRMACGNKGGRGEAPSIRSTTHLLSL